jgi:hypothetical protein
MFEIDNQEALFLCFQNLPRFWGLVCFVNQTTLATHFATQIVKNFTEAVA